MHLQKPPLYGLTGLLQHEHVILTVKRAAITWQPMLVKICQAPKALLDGKDGFPWGLSSFCVNNW